MVQQLVASADVEDTGDTTNSVLQQLVASAYVEDTGDTTNSVHHASAVPVRPSASQKCNRCGQLRKGHKCSYVQGTILWKDLCEALCKGGRRRGCDTPQCTSSGTKRARGNEDASGGAAECVSISGGGRAQNAPGKAPADTVLSAATSKKRAMASLLERQQASAPAEQARFKTQLFDRLRKLPPDVVQNTRSLTRALHAFDEEFLEENMDGWLKEWREQYSDLLVGPDTEDAQFDLLAEALDVEQGSEVQGRGDGHVWLGEPSRVVPGATGEGSAAAGAGGMGADSDRVDVTTQEEVEDAAEVVVVQEEEEAK